MEENNQEFKPVSKETNGNDQKGKGALWGIIIGIFAVIAVLIFCIIKFFVK